MQNNPLTFDYNPVMIMQVSVKDEACGQGIADLKDPCLYEIREIAARVSIVVRPPTHSA